MSGKGKKSANGADSKFFTTNRKGENHELREELRSPQRDRYRWILPCQVRYEKM